MSTPTNKVYVVGHTSHYGVSVPANRNLKGHEYETLTVAHLGAKLAFQLLEKAVLPTTWELFCLTPPIKFNGSDIARRAWRMQWHPQPREDAKGKPPEYVTLRVGAIQEVGFLEPYSSDLVPAWEPPLFHILPLQQEFLNAALYLCFDVTEAAKLGESSPFQSLEQHPPAIVLLHLTASKPVEDFGPLQNLLKILAKVKRLVIVVGDRCLQHLKLSINDDNSWEAFADSLVELNLWKNADLGFNQLEKCDLVVRHGAYSAVRLNPQNQSKELHYITDAGHSIAAPPGFLRGHNSLLGVSILIGLLEDNEHNNDCKLVEGIANGLRRCMEFEKAGFCREMKATLQIPLVQSGLQPTIKSRAIPNADAPIRARKKWSVIDLVIAEQNKGSQLENAYQIGKTIVLEGLTAAVNAYGFPVVRFGGLTIVDRIAYEQMREIQATMRDYLGSFRHKKMPPLCLGVFGAPGGGKSFGVKQLAGSLHSEHLAWPPLEVNVSQLSGPEDLKWVFRQIRDTTLEGKVPLVFFDEFDTPRGVPFGWLQTFLAPMQDGRFGTEPDAIEFRHGIFIFIGGVNHTFAMFNGRSRDREFIAAKGPDFVSRLSRHLNVLGISWESDDDPTYMIRRAVLIRETLARYHKNLFVKDSDRETARIDEAAVRKLLKIKSFRHGVRSLEAILRTSRLSPDQPFFHLNSFPPDWQLDMHLDLSEFQQL